MEVTAKGILYKIATLFELKRNTTKQRLILQKTIYLLEEYGMQLGYGFGWYKYGPYSQDLVQDAYSVLYAAENYYKTETSEWKFSPESEKIFGDFKTTFAGVLGDAEMLELVASIHFIKTRWQPDINEGNVADIFFKHKKFYFNGKKIKEAKIKEAFAISQKLVHA